MNPKEEKNAKKIFLVVSFSLEPNYFRFFSFILKRLEIKKVRKKKETKNGVNARLCQLPFDGILARMCLHHSLVLFLFRFPHCHWAKISNQKNFHRLNGHNINHYRFSLFFSCFIWFPIFFFLSFFLFVFKSCVFFYFFCFGFGKSISSFLLEFRFIYVVKKPNGRNVTLCHLIRRICNGYNVWRRRRKKKRNSTIWLRCHLFLFSILFLLLLFCCIHRTFFYFLCSRSVFILFLSFFFVFFITLLMLLFL